MDGDGKFMLFSTSNREFAACANVPMDRRRTRVVERPCGLDVSGVNALSVPEFLSHELGNDS